MPTSSDPLIFALIALVVGLLVGALVASLLASGRQTQKSVHTPAVRPLPRESRPIIETPPPLLPADRYQPLVQLWRDLENQGMVVEIACKAYQNVAELGADQRKNVENWTKEWLTWQGLLKPKPAATVPVSAPTPISSPAGAAPITNGVVGSIAQQIDAILQEMLVGTAYAEKGIHLSDQPGFGAIVWVGATRYDGIDCVPDPEIKRLLQAAAREWEKRGG